MIKDKAKKYHWSIWAGICAEMGWAHESGARKDERRYAFYAEAGCPISLTRFDDDAMDAFLEAAWKLCPQLFPKGRPARDGKRKRLVWRIETDAKKADLFEEYLKRIATDLTGLGCWRDLAMDDLENFRNAIHNRAGKKRSYSMDAAPKSFVQKSDLQPL